MVRIIAIDKEGKNIFGSERNVSNDYWQEFQKVKNLRWKEIKVNIKKEENGTKRKKRNAPGSVVRKARR